MKNRSFKGLYLKNPVFTEANVLRDAIIILIATKQRRANNSLANQFCHMELQYTTYERNMIADHKIVNILSLE